MFHQIILILKKKKVFLTTIERMNEMKKIIIVLVFLSLSACASLTTNRQTYVYVTPQNLGASQLSKNKCNCKEGEKGCISIYYKGKVIDTMTKECFQAMVDSLEIQNRVALAEKGKEGYSTKIELEHNPWQFTIGTKYKTNVTIVWLDNNKKEIKSVIIQGTFEVRKENLSKIRIIYRNISEYGFPAAIIAIFVMSFFI